MQVTTPNRQSESRYPVSRVCDRVRSDSARTPFERVQAKQPYLVAGDLDVPRLLKGAEDLVHALTRSPHHVGDLGLRERQVDGCVVGTRHAALGEKGQQQLRHPAMKVKEYEIRRLVREAPDEGAEGAQQPLDDPRTLTDQLEERFERQDEDLRRFDRLDRGGARAAIHECQLLA